MLMYVSHNEIYDLSLKALESLNIPLGQREDAAYAVAWLEQHHLSALPYLHRALLAPESLLLPSHGPTTLNQSLEHAVAFDAEKHSVFTTGRMMLDALQAYHQHKGNPEDTTILTIYGCCDALSLLAHQHDLPYDSLIQLMCPSTSASSLFSYCSASSDKLHVVGTGDLQAFEKTCCIASLILNPKPLASHSPIKNHTLDVNPKQWHAKKQKSLNEGIAVSKEVWQAITKYANAVLVPESEYSRLHGAGETAP